tara:strand:- start:3508 stop:4602 length:1095 start_codon:yes stop_codon:yes gene_type:complete
MNSKLKILIVGSTGELGSKLLKYCNKNNINIFAITGFSNKKKLQLQGFKFNIKYTYLLSNKNEEKSFRRFLTNIKIDIIYFLDFGYESILYADIFLKNNINSCIAIANKEMIIAGGKLLINKIVNSKNKLIPLDSEHFSISNFNLKNEFIKKIYITASGGPFYFKKYINLNNVNLKKVLDHPKWKMGINNSIDSSNFINKILEMYELSIIYNIDLKKIDFLISSEAYIHSVIINNDNIININCFNNNMLITLMKPLQNFIPDLFMPSKNDFLKIDKMKLEKFNDKRFKITNFLNFLKKLSHSEQISFMILNNIAQKKYLNSEIKYNYIINYIMTNINKIKLKKEFKSFDDTIKFIKTIKNNYDY